MRISNSVPCTPILFILFWPKCDARAGETDRLDLRQYKQKDSAMTDYVMVETDDGVYALDPDIIQRIAYEEAYYRVKYSSRKRVDADNEWFGPSTYHYEFDFAKAKEAGKAAAAKILGQSSVFSSLSRARGGEIRAFRMELALMESNAKNYKKQILHLVSTANDDSMKSIHSTTSRLETGLKALQFTRDAAADVFIVCAGFLSGGAFLALGAGAVAKGAFKYQDTQNLGSATLTAVVGFTVGVVGIAGKAAQATEKLAIIIVQEKFDFMGQMGIALAEGKSIQEAAVSSTVAKAAGLGVGAVTKSLDVEDLRALSSQIGPIAMTLKAELVTPVSGKAVAQIAGKAAASGVTGLASEKVSEQIMSYINSAPAKASRMDIPVPIGDPVLAELAVLGPDECRVTRYW